MAQKATTIDITKINALAELERIGWKFEPRGDDEVAIICPAHEDSTPSCFLNVKKNKWLCQAASCKKHGDIISLLAYMLNSSRAVVIEDLHTRYKLIDVRSIKLETIEKYHSHIWHAGPLLTALRDRGITDEMIRDTRLGFHNGRITIPVPSEDGRIINVRRYLPGAPPNQKMKNTQGYTPLALYPIDQMKYDTIWICGGEMKALVAAAFLNPIGIGAVCVTAGEGAWDASFNRKFEGKIVFVCFDVDSGGVTGSRKVAAQVSYSAKEVSVIHLPLDLTKHPKGDINDWVATEGAKTPEFAKAMKNANKFKLDELTSHICTEDTNALPVRLAKATDPELIGKRIVCDTIITAMDTTPYLIPKEVRVDCVVDGGKGDTCNFCPVRAVDPNKDSGLRLITIRETNPGILEMIGVPTFRQEEAIKKCIAIPFGCKTSVVTVKSHYTVIDAKLAPQLQISGDNKDHIVQSAYLIDAKDVDLNTPYSMSGRVYPHPKDQQAVLMMDRIEQGEDNLTSFTPTSEELDCLKVLRPKEWTVDSIHERLNNRYDDLEANVTQIYKRRNMHLLLDLSFHSCLYFPFDKRRQNGWTNTIIIGDSAQGKSEASQRLTEFYGVGTKHDCKNATAAGLIGGLVQIAGRWHIAWGIIPMHDRRYVTLEEGKGASVEVFGQMTDMRSSGIAEISKIEKRRAFARTRIMLISNPRSGRTVSAYNFGVETISELLGAPEDVRRFDMAIIVAESQVNPEDINKLNKHRPKVESTHTSELCRRCILWAWTRNEDQIRFDKDVEDLCLELAIKLCKDFTEALPLCDKGTMRYKIARLAVSLAAMTFSTYKDNNEIILVKKCHVKYIYNFIRKEYSRPEFGYLDFSKAQVFSNSLIDSGEVTKRICGVKYPEDFVTQMIHRDEITLIDIMDWIEADRDTAQRILSLLVRKHAIYRTKRWYVKTSEFIVLLKKLKDSGKLKNFAEAAGKEEF